MPTPKKATALKLIDGEKNKKRINTDEPKPVPIAPKCPQHIKGDARKLWKSLAPKLEKLGLLTEIDGLGFEALCHAYGRYREAERKLAKRDLIFITDKGNEIQDPLIGISNKALEQVYKLGKEFGLSPASRSGISIKKLTDEEDPMEAFLRKQGK